MRLPHVRCECCRSLHLAIKGPDGWSYRCDWAKINPRVRDRERFIYLEVTPPSKAEQWGGAMGKGVWRAGQSEIRAQSYLAQRDRQRIPPTPEA